MVFLGTRMVHLWENFKQSLHVLDLGFFCRTHLFCGCYVYVDFAYVEHVFQWCSIGYCNIDVEITYITKP